MGRGMRSGRGNRKPNGYGRREEKPCFPVMQGRLNIPSQLTNHDPLRTANTAEIS